MYKHSHKHWNRRAHGSRLFYTGDTPAPTLGSRLFYTGDISPTLGSRLFYTGDTPIATIETHQGSGSQ